MVCAIIGNCETLVTYREFVNFCRYDKGYEIPWCPLNKSQEVLRSPQDWLKDEEVES